MNNKDVYVERKRYVESKAREMLAGLTLEEKFKLLTSNARRRFYVTDPIKRLEIPSFKMTDGPLGVARHSGSFKKCTRFPATIALAATWNRDLPRAMGKAIAREVASIGRHMLLAPGTNIHRTPLNGRTFEYFSEDPHLTKEMAIPFVKGVQEEGIGACLKHYAANNQETDRRSSNSVVDERTLHEIYLRAFRETVIEADPWAVMGSYNKVNGTYGCEHKYLIRDILMERWNFDGFVVSDWFATRPIETTEGCVNGGLSLEMPWPARYKTGSLQKSFEKKLFSEEAIDDLVLRILRVMFLCGAFENGDSPRHDYRNSPEHQELSRKIAEEGMVLLKNDSDLLPLNPNDATTIFVAGPNLKKKFGKLLYGGSSAVVPLYEITPYEGLKERIGKDCFTDDPEKADIAIIFAGLDHGKGKDSETADRKTLKLPGEQISLIIETAKVNPNTIVVLIAGSPISMDDWLDNVPTVLIAWYAGMESGRAITNVLFGDTSPSGKLPITFPKILSDSPAHSTGYPKTYPGDEEKNVHYEEGILVGYRWFDTKEIEPLFPFGFGLSYTDFIFGSSLIESSTVYEMDDRFEVKVELENIGPRIGSEVIQVYASIEDSAVQRPKQELVGFKKIYIKDKEKAKSVIKINARDLAYYDIKRHDWRLEPGVYRIFIGNSSRSIFDEHEILIKK